MSNVIDIFSRKQSAKSDTEENLEQTETDFAEIIKANKVQKERLVRDRAKHNKKTFRQYKIKPKGE